MAKCSICSSITAQGRMYCLVCLEKLNHQRKIEKEIILNTSALKKTYYLESESENHKKIFKVIFLFLALSTVILILALNFNNNQKLSANMSEALLLAFTVAGLSIHILALIMMILKVLVFDPLWAIFSIFLPWLLYLYALIIDPVNYKKYLLTMLISSVFFSASTIAYSTIRMNKPGSGVLLAGSFIISPIFSVINFEKLVKVNINYRNTSLIISPT